jgi:hypothetical protein
MKTTSEKITKVKSTTPTIEKRIKKRPKLQEDETLTHCDTHTHKNDETKNDDDCPGLEIPPDEEMEEGEVEDDKSKSIYGDENEEPNISSPIALNQSFCQTS